MYVRKEAVLSSQIEGTQSSLNDLLELEAEILDPERPNDVDEVLSYVRAMNKGLALLDDLPVSVRLFKQIHTELMQGVRGKNRNPGELRKIQNWIGPEGCDVHNATFVDHLNHGPSTSSYTNWFNQKTGNSGIIHTTRSYHKGPIKCKDYSATVDITNRWPLVGVGGVNRNTIFGITCQMPDGSRKQIDCSGTSQFPDPLCAELKKSAP